MFYAIVILVVLIAIVKLAKPDGCWRWQCAAESFGLGLGGSRTRQLQTAALTNAHIADPAVTIEIPSLASTPAADYIGPLPAPTIPAPLMPLRTITLHRTAWCTACALIKPAWDRLKRDVPDIVYAEVDEDIKPTPGIMGYPTIILRDPLGTVQYRGPPAYNELRRWATAPTPYWA